MTDYQGITGILASSSNIDGNRQTEKIRKWEVKNSGASFCLNIFQHK